MGAFDDLAAQFDSANKKRKGDQFEAVCKWYLENDPNYKPLLRRVWLWNDWPGRKTIDAGIDLVAEDYDGNLWAIQAKAYDPAYSISRHDINKFVAEASRKQFAYRVLIGTTDKRHQLATTLMDDLSIPFIGLTQLRRADAYLDWPATPSALRPARPLTPKRPWEYQKLAIKDVVNGFKTADRGQLIMACGTGKTLVAWFIKEKLAAERTLVLVPSLSLMKQTMTEWRLANPKKPFAALPVCSDETVGSLGEDAAVSHTSDLGVPVTTDKKVIAEFLRKRSGPRVVFSTYQSSDQVAEAFKLKGVPAFDLVIADEAHRVAGSMKSEFGTVLDAAKIKAKKLLFMTATPRYFTGRVLREAKEVDYQMASMDDPALFGTVLHRLTFAQAIDQDLLTDYRVAIIGVDNATYRDWAQRAALITLDGTTITDARWVAGQIGLAKAMRKFNMRRVISFHSRVRAAREFAASMPTVVEWMPARQRPKGRLWSEYASGEMSARERDQLIQQLKRLDDADRGLLANARCLSEGVDVPALDGVAFIDPKRSEVDIVQAVGRAIRKSDTKNLGTIVIPVFIDTDGGDPDAVLDSSVFKPVWDVVKALRAHDTELGEYLDALRREMGRRKGCKPGLQHPRLYVDLPSVTVDFARAFNVHLVDATTAPWEFWYGLMETYVAEHGTAVVPRDYTVDGYKLGQWLKSQRRRHSTGDLTAERTKRLEELPGWSWDIFGEKWERGFKFLTDYVKAHGTADVKQSTKMRGFGLGIWVNTQRVRQAEGTLEANRVERLEALPGWAWHSANSKWEANYARLAEFAKHHGHVSVPYRYTVDGYRLGTWVVSQRVRYREGRLDRSLVERLEKLPGWQWNPYDNKWDSTFALLVKFVEQNGTSRVPGNLIFGGANLGKWVSVQRTNHNAGKLSEVRTGRLANLPDWTWNSDDATWDEFFDLLTAYAKEHGDACVPVAWRLEDGRRLGQWVGTQRTFYSRGTLSPERQHRLESLPGWVWNTRDAKWHRGFEELKKYVTKHGTARVPRPCLVDGYDVGQWVKTQRRNYAMNSLSTEQIRQLESLRGWVWRVSNSD